MTRDPAVTLTWPTLLEQWASIEADLHAVYGVDVDTPGLLDVRTWRWLRARIVGLLADPRTRTSRALADRR